MQNSGNALRHSRVTAREDNQPSRRLIDGDSTGGYAIRLALLWCAGASLRLTVLALPPVLDEITTSFRLDPVAIGILTAIPPLVFAAGALPGAVLIQRANALICLLVGLALTAVGAAARGFAGSALALDIATAVMCAGVAIMQPAMPALVRGWAAQRIGLASATYTFGLLVGEIAPVVWPLQRTIVGLASGWQSQLLVWAFPVASTAAAIVILRPSLRSRSQNETAASPWPDWSGREVWWVGMLMGSIGAAYLGLNGFIPAWLRHNDDAAAIGTALIALNVAQLPAVILMLRYAERLAFQGWVYVATGALLLLGSALLALGPATLVLVAAAVAGFCSAILLSLVITLQPLVATDETVPALSAGTFAVGFAIAGVVAIVTGLLGATGMAWLGVGPIAAACLTVITVGSKVARLCPDQASSPQNTRS